MEPDTITNKMAKKRKKMTRQCYCVCYNMPICTDMQIL
jgi:hypothetical protein